MSRMDVEETIRVILEQQQRMGAHLERLDRSLLELAELQSRQGERIDLAFEGIRQLTVVAGQLTGGLTQLRDIVEQLAQQHSQFIQDFAAFRKSTEERFQGLAEAQRHTHEDLNALIKIVDDLIRRDGRQS